MHAYIHTYIHTYNQPTIFNTHINTLKKHLRHSLHVRRRGITQQRRQHGQTQHDPESLAHQAGRQHNPDVHFGDGRQRTRVCMHWPQVVQCPVAERARTREVHPAQTRKTKQKRTRVAPSTKHGQKWTGTRNFARTQAVRCPVITCKTSTNLFLKKNLHVATSA